MSIQSEIDRISGNVADALDEIELKGVTIPSGANSDDLAALIRQITAGTTGIVYITDELDEHGGIVRHLVTDGATVTDTTDSHGGTVRSITGAEVYLQVKTVTPGAAQQTITADQGYGALGKVIVEAESGETLPDGDEIGYGITDATSPRVGIGKVGSMII